MGISELKMEQLKQTKDKHSVELNALRSTMGKNIAVTGHITIMYIHHNLLITLFLGSIAETILVKQPCYIQTKMYRLY